MKAILYADGGSRGNPGPSAGAAVLYDARKEELGRIGRHIGTATNNVAEYTGLLLGITMAAAKGVTQLEVRMDSELIIKQMRGEYRVKHPSLQPLHARVARVAATFTHIAWHHVPRAQNAAADALVNLYLDRGIIGAHEKMV